MGEYLSMPRVVPGLVVNVFLCLLEKRQPGKMESV